jgi:hypothetical protein
MIVSTHQPILLPWPGFFYKAARSDCMVLLDDVQFPRGASWLNRNRLKNETGGLWVTVPVWKKGRGLQKICEVEVYDERGWRKKHLRSIEQNYVHAPYLDTFHPSVAAAYAKNDRRLVEFNLRIIELLWEALALPAKPILQSDLGVTGEGTDLLIAICERIGADRYAVLQAGEKHIESARMRAAGIALEPLRFHPPVYPQLWGEFIYNLSTLDLLLNCGPKSIEVISKAGSHEPPE